MNLIKLNAPQGFTEEQVATLNNAFLEPLKIAQELESNYLKIANAPITPSVCNEADELRKKYVKIRTATDKLHKSEKQYYLQAGRYVDDLKKEVLSVVSERENKLKDVAEYFENIRKAEIAKLEEERTGLLLPYTQDIPKGVGEMTQDLFETILEGAKVKHAQEQERIEQERIKKEEEAKELEKLRQEKKALEQELEKAKNEAKVLDVVSPQVIENTSKESYADAIILFQLKAINLSGCSETFSVRFDELRNKMINYLTPLVK